MLSVYLTKMIIENPCRLYKKKLEIGIGFYDLKTGKKTNKFINPKDLVEDDIVLTNKSSISTEIFKLAPNLSVTILNSGRLTHILIPTNSVPKILKNEVLFNKLSSYKKRKLVWTFCKAVCSRRIAELQLLNEKRDNSRDIKNILKKMRELDRKLIKCKHREEMMGLEGNIAKLFYLGLSKINPLFGITRKRDATDIVNVSMNLCHTLLRNKIKIRLIERGLNISRGFLHHRDGRIEDYLVWDFSEFWLPYVDKLILYSLERGIIKPRDVSEKGKLSEKAKNKLVRLIDTRVKKSQIDVKINQFVNYLKNSGRFSFV